MTDDIDISDVIQRLCVRCNKNSVEHGFWEESRNKAEMVALMHSELSELLEYLRNGDQQSDHIDYSGVEEELADVLIRVFDFAGGFGLNLEGALLAKMLFNESRPYKHGKAF